MGLTKNQPMYQQDYQSRQQCMTWNFLLQHHNPNDKEVYALDSAIHPSSQTGALYNPMLGKDSIVYTKAYQTILYSPSHPGKSIVQTEKST
jgi:hypothetical protein